MKIPGPVEDALDWACGLAGMTPPERHGFTPVGARKAHEFWRMSDDGTRFLAIGGEIYAFHLQIGRLSFIVETPAEAQFIKDAYKARHEKAPDAPGRE